MARLMQVGERLHNHTIGWLEPLRALRFCSAAPAPQAKPCHGNVPSKSELRPRQLPQRSTRTPRPNNWAANDASIFRK
jgi:hypothetical protein